MSRRPGEHPTTDEWIGWLEGAGRSGDALDRHRQSCRACEGLLAVLSGFRAGGPGVAFGAPPEELRARARALAGSSPQAAPEREPLPPLQPATADDVRGALGDLGEMDDLPGDGRELLLGGEYPGAQVHLAARELPARGEVVLAGKLWLEEPGGGKIELLLLQEDHVLCREELQDGEFFLLRELAEPGWAVEFHLPGGECIRFDGAGPTP